jgi:hypothetical protein
MKMEAAGFSESFVPLYQIRRLLVVEYSNHEDPETHACVQIL